MEIWKFQEVSIRCARDSYSITHCSCVHFQAFETVENPYFLFQALHHQIMTMKNSIHYNPSLVHSEEKSIDYFAFFNASESGMTKTFSHSISVIFWKRHHCMASCVAPKLRKKRYNLLIWIIPGL